MTEQTEQTYDAPQPETETMAKCVECEAISSLDDVDRLYECGNCGSHGFGIDERRCPDCNKFTAKITDHGCPECQEGECEEVEAVLDEETGEFIEFTDWEAEHTTTSVAPGEPKLESKRQRLEREADEVKAHEEAVEAWLNEHAHRTVAERVPEGSYLVERDRNGVLYASWSKVASVNVQRESRMARFGDGSEREVPPNVTLWAGGIGSNFNYPLGAEVCYLNEEQHQELKDI